MLASRAQTGLTMCVGRRDVGSRSDLAWLGSGVTLLFGVARPFLPIRIAIRHSHGAMMGKFEPERDCCRRTEPGLHHRELVPAQGRLREL